MKHDLLQVRRSPRRVAWRGSLCGLLAACTFTWVGSVLAHPMGFGTAELSFEPDRVRLELVLDAPTTEESAEQRERLLQQRVSAGVHMYFDGKKLPLRARVLALGEGPTAVDVVELTIASSAVPEQVALQIDATVGDVVWEVRRVDGLTVHRELLVAGSEPKQVSLSAPPVLSSGPTSNGKPARGAPASTDQTELGPAPRPAPAPALPFGSYLRIGFEHILPKGVDHVLFVLGVFVTQLRLGRLCLELSLFTVAHSLTLLLSALGWVSVSPRLVEPLIALSIAALGAEVFIPRMERARLPLIFGFGLLHGLGFAAALSATGLTAAQLLWPLLGFNLGVELGQLTVVALALLATFKLRQQPERFRSYFQKPVAWALIAVGSYWCLERLFTA